MKPSLPILFTAICTVFASQTADAATLAHRYSFDEGAELVDSVGGNTGVLVGGATVSGGELILDNSNGNGPTATSMQFTNLVDIGGNFGATGATIETWYTDTGSGTWAKLFTFGTSVAGQEWGFTHIRSNTSESGLDRGGNTDLGLRPTLNEEHHLVISVAADGTTNLWIDGAQILTDAPTSPLADVVTTHEAIGSTAWNDPGHLGSVNEFRIWEGTFNSFEVEGSAIAGPDNLPSADDSDGDGLPDAWEERWFGAGNLSQGADDNPDDDGLTNLEEFNADPELDPDDPDTDDDGLDDGPELLTHLTNPRDDDSDDDTLLDGAEVNVHQTDPLLQDSDMDFYTDPVEIANGTDPNDPDDPGALERAELAHRYSFSDGAELIDSVGGIDGVLVGSASVSGGSLLLDGVGSGPGASSMQFSDTIGIGENFGALGVTVETWYTDTGSGTWAKLFTFGTNAAGQELAYTNVRANPVEAGIDRDGAQLLGAPPAQNVEHHLVVTVSPDGNLNTWIDGTQLLTDVDTNDLGNVVSSTESIGSTAWGDPGHLGEVNEFRIWRGELSGEEVAQNLAAGPDAVGNGAPFVVSSIDYDLRNNRVTLTWNSVQGRSYAIDRSPDMQDRGVDSWLELEDKVATGEVTTFEDQPPPDTRRMYYRVRDITPP